MIYAFGAYELDTQLYELRHAGQPCALQPQVFNILAYLIEHRDHVVTKDDLIAHVWPEPFVSDATLHQRLTAARRAVGDSGHTQGVIKTLRGRGYRFIAEVAERQASPGSLLSPATASDLLCALPGERKLVTVLFGALANSTALAERLGLECLPRLRQTFISLAQDDIQRYDGTFQPVGDDSFQALFGVPLAQEDHARRALLAALALQRRLGEPYTDADTQHEVSFAVSLGMHTGTVMVGGNIDDAQQSALVVGEVLTVAAQLQHRAEPGMLLVSEDTMQQLPEEVHSERVVDIPITAQTEPLKAFRVRGLGPSRAPSGRRDASSLTRFVGRERELTMLHAILRQAENGQGHVVGIMGEPGIGKSRLLYEFVQGLTGKPVTYLEGHCLSYGSATPYLPVLDVLRQLCRMIGPDTPATITAHVERCLTEVGMAPVQDAPYLHHLLGLSEGTDPLATLSPQTVKKRTFAILHQLILRSSQQQTLVMAVENLHWSDPTSEEWLAGLVEALAQAPLLLITTYRPGYRPLWMDKSYATQLALARLTPEDSRTVVQSKSRHEPLPDVLLQAILTKGAGNPFFLEELTRAMAERGGRQATVEVPDSVQAVLAARMDRLPPAEKQLLQIASVIGAEVPLPLLQAIAKVPEAVLDHNLGQLQMAEFLYENQTVFKPTYAFKHALTREVAYQSLLESTRQQYHHRIAQVLETKFPEVVETQPELLAHHYTKAGLNEPAVGYWQRAGQHAIQRSAHVEAISHLSQGLALLTMLPQTSTRQQQELDLQVALGPVLIATKGYAAPEVQRAFARAQELCKQMGDTPQLFPVLRGLLMYYNARGRTQEAYQLGEQLLHLAQAQPEPTSLMLAHHMLGMVLFWRGEPAVAHVHHSQAFAIYTPQEHQALAISYGADLGTSFHSFLAWELWQLGYPDRAMQHSQVACRLAQEGSHAYSLANALLWATVLHQFRREAWATQQQAEALISLTREQGFVHWLAQGTVLHGWALAMQGQNAQGIAGICQGLAASLATGARVWQPYSLAMLAEAYGEGGHPEEGLPLLAEALAVMEDTALRFYGAELYRLEGDLLLRNAARDVSQVEACFQQALDIARHQQAKSWELRAATSFARLWQSQGKRQQAYDLLAPVYEWFTEGFDTVDLQDAKALLRELEG